ncbi:hypothetical protein K227x_62420 [Rubripirellula lacrimiformis]|uniref:Uncharacterized protein n=1 Tax=Rubripirellula lacrimiformis TaxID=1930273 RepID=A0A517NKZ8_9BACT|nr:hypothetical protein [Rubripirellula lacrimiformis]QDT07814.1 hypothetical protein K227x_62420 [Rubripirellula lacrimiformis]
MIRPATTKAAPPDFTLRESTNPGGHIAEANVNAFAAAAAAVLIAAKKQRRLREEMQAETIPATSDK